MTSKEASTSSKINKDNQAEHNTDKTVIVSAENLSNDNSTDDKTILLGSDTDNSTQTMSGNERSLSSQSSSSLNDDQTVLQTSTFIECSDGLTPGTVINQRFDILEEIGSGGMGTVYKALDRRDVEAGNSRFIAIKILNNEHQNNEDLLQLLYEETRNTQSLAHNNIVRVYDFDRDSSLNITYMTMEFIDGAPLDKIIKNHPTGIKTETAIDIINQIANALSYAHSQHIVHLDLKPGNIFIDRNDKVKVLDFGIAQKIADLNSLADSAVSPETLGLTVSHASIELLSGMTPSESDDIYAFACICYEILTGHHPYGVKSDIAYQKKLNVKKIDSLNKQQWKALEQTLQLKKSKRTKTINEFISEFNKKPTTVGFYIFACISLIVALGSGYFFIQPHIDLPLESQNIDYKEKKGTPEQTQVVTKTAEVPVKQPSFEAESLKIWTDQPRYLVGNTLQISFQVDKAMYVQIYIINSVGELTQILPNPYQLDNFLQPNQVYQIPPANAEFTLDINPPLGVDKIVAFASPDPIPAGVIDVDHRGQIIDNPQIRTYLKAQTSYAISD